MWTIYPQPHLTWLEPQYVIEMQKLYTLTPVNKMCMMSFTDPAWTEKP